jgi:hypothetical protein
MAITGGITLLQKLQKLYGARNVSDMMGRTTNVQTLAQGTNNPFAQIFSKKYLKKNPDGVEEASKVIMENMQFAFGNKNPQQMKNFENNVNTLFEIKFPPAKAEAEILDLSTKKQVTGKGIDSLKDKMGLPPDVKPNSPMGQILTQQKQMDKVFSDMGTTLEGAAKTYSTGIEARRRAAMRQILLRDKRINLTPEEIDSLKDMKDLQKNADPNMDPMVLLNKYYKRDNKKLEILDDVIDESMRPTDAADNFLAKDDKLELADKDLGTKLKDFDGDPDAMAQGGRAGFKYGGSFQQYIKREDEYKDLNFEEWLREDKAQGGIAGQLHLNEGGRVGLQEGGLPTVKSVGGVPNVEGGRIVYDLGNGSYIYESPSGYEIVENGIYTSLGTKEYSDGSARPLKHLFEDGIIMRRANDPILLEQQAQSAKTAAPTIAAPTIAAPTIAAPTIAAPTPIGIQTTPGDKKTFNVMMDEKGNVQDDQSLTELFRETGTAPYIGQNNQINSMSDVFRLAGITNEGGISMGTDYGGSRTLPSGGIANTLPSVEQRMQAAAAKGLDARMGRTYAENIQAMADPRMATQMPPMPIDLMPPMSSEFRQGPGEFADPNVSAANPGGYASQDEAIADLGIERYNELYNMGGRVGFKNGGPPNPGRRTFLKLMGGLASLPVVGKLFKGAKVASKIPVLKNTTTTMPAWFPDLVDKFVAKGVGKKIDQDMMEYTVKELPDVKLLKQDNGAIRVEGKNAYNEEYYIDYEPPGVEVVDFDTGKTVKTKGDFVATDTEYRMISPEDYDIDGVTVNDVDELLGGSSNQLEGFAKGTGKTKNTIGQRRIDEADARGASSKEEYGRTDRADVYDPYEGMDGSDFVDPEDYATGGRVGMLSGGGVMKTIIKNLAKERGVKPSFLLEIINAKSLPKQIRDNMSPKEIKSFLEKRIEQVKNFKEMMSSRVKFNQSIQQGKALDDQGTGMSDIFDFMDQNFTKGSPVPRNVDEADVLQMEQMIKNMEMKDRKLNAKGGLAGQLL